ncbi:hypothetical protein R3P38DRAFT_1296978 [Favolaschia claudopus]
MVQLMAAPANGLLTLEGQNTTCAHVFYVWVIIAWHLEKVLADPSSSAGRHRAEVIQCYNDRFEQMMTESSSNVFLLAYFLHPLFRKCGGLQLTMPANKNADTLKPAQYPSLFVTLFKAAMEILKGEQLRYGKGGKEEVVKLQKEFIRYAYQQSPFDTQYFDSSTKPLDYWTRLSGDSNATQISRIAVKIFSIMPSEICDERTASRLGWFNAARRSSILPENLIDCARLYDYYTNGITEGAYSHEVHVALDDVLAVPRGTVQQRSAPSLMDIINEENITPSAADAAAAEELLFNHPDPYDLDETSRLDLGPAVVRSQTVFAIAQYIKLESTTLAALIQPSKDDSQPAMGSTGAVASVPAGVPTDWSVEDFLN